MTERELDQHLVATALGLDPTRLTPDQLDRATSAARRTDRGGELERRLISAMTDEEITAAKIAIEDALLGDILGGISPARLSVEQRERLVEKALADARAERDAMAG